MSGYIGNIPVPQATQTRDTFTATSGQTSFATSGYTPGFLDVYLNGVHLVNGTDYTASNGSDVVLTSGATTGDNLEVVAYTTFQVVDQSFSGNFSVDSPTFVVDAANNRVGVGTASPTRVLHLSASGTESAIRLDNTVSGRPFIVTYDDSQNLEFTNSSDTGYIAFRNGTGAGTERLRITSAGSVGIGTTSVSGILSVDGSMYAGPGSVSGVAYGFYPSSTYGNTGMFSPAANTVAFATSGGERCRIDASGNLMVGTTGSNHKLYVVDTTDRAQTFAQFAVAGAGYSFFTHLDGAACYLGQNSDARAFRIYSGSNPAVGVNLAAGGTSWGTYSDERVKTALKPIEDALDKVSSLRAVTGRYLTDDETVSRSFLIAQDVQAVLPEAVDVGTDENKTLLLKYTEVMPLLVAAIKDQQAIIEALEARISALEGEPA